MKKYYFIGTIFSLLVLSGIMFGMITRCATPGDSNGNGDGNQPGFEFNTTEAMQLPDPVTDGEMSLEEALTLRRSKRSYADEPLNIEQVSQLLWSAQGVTSPEGYRTAPSAGATLPLEMFFVVRDVEGLDQGIYQYHPDDHTITLVREGSFYDDLTSACLGQSMVREASVNFIFGAVFERTTERYDDRGVRYVYNEIGHASQNLHLQAAALDLGTVVIGAYDDDEVEEILSLGPDISVLYIMPVGHIE